MTEIPLAWLVTVLAAIAIALVWRAVRMPVAARVFIGAGFGALGVVGLLLGLRLVHGTAWAPVLQPLVAIVPAPAFYLGLRALTEEGAHDWPRTALRHGVPLGLVLGAIVASGFWLADLLLPAVTFAYSALLLRLALLPGEAFVQVAPQDVRAVRAAILLALAFFVATLVADIAILLALVRTGPSSLPGMVGGAAAVMTGLVFVAALVGVPLILARRDGAARDAGTPAGASAEDRALLRRFDEMLVETGLHADSALTVARAARRLGVPARALSSAVNRAGATNFSRHVNAYRVAHADRLLRETDLPVTEIMLEVGFVSKSAFNTEFRRITGTTPSARRSHG